ncbi:hypothetical protein G7066_07230 [Leucobacter coleopterorum]|uniref:Uncharacterized protein n=1 Tax=Leucobacter coleopterorum TaxID=2714933 RepID=A0ABX6JVZ0_9MICO|nr:hypothetical protein [Leucobacter coleopterorum]QIM18471.1 hypothetical protein G7066_07230 [Leucobacter coleopterorum]
MGTESRRGAKRALRISAFVMVVIALIVAFAHRQDIQDHFSASSFDPSTRTVEVMKALQLTPTGKRVFLASHPTVDGSQKFNEQCANVDHSEEGHVLGCFTGDRIHLFDVTDKRVRGIVEVTAAHELLHAAFSRLSDGDRTAYSEKLLNEYDVMSTNNPELVDRMSVYSHLSDSAFANELNSVLGTEVRDLPTWLNTHYATWFKDRGALVDVFDSYHSVFIGLQDRAEDLQSEMSSLRADVEQRNLSYDAAVKQFNLDAAEFRARNERFEFSETPDEFDRIRAELSERRSALQAALTDLQADIDHYNDLRKQLQELGQVSSELAGKLNSDLAPVTTRPEE